MFYSTSIDIWDNVTAVAVKTVVHINYYNLIIFRFTKMTYIQSQVFNILLESCYYKSEKTIGRIALVERSTPKWTVLECKKK